MGDGGRPSGWAGHRAALPLLLLLLMGRLQCSLGLSGMSPQERARMRDRVRDM